MTKKIIAASITVAVLAGSTVFAQSVHKPRKTQRIVVNLTENGYRPSSFRLQKGVGARVTFIRKTNATCGQEIVIPAYGVRRDLPLNQRVTVSFMPRQTGTFNFTCGMDMLRGKIIVN